jgi:Uma2 family endonuclease
VMEKVRDYLANGTRLVWVIDPKDRSAAIFTPRSSPVLIQDDGVLDGADVIPGFSVILRDLLP